MTSRGPFQLPIFCDSMWFCEQWISVLLWIAWHNQGINKWGHLNWALRPAGFLISDAPARQSLTSHFTSLQNWANICFPFNYVLHQGRVLKKVDELESWMCFLILFIFLCVHCHSGKFWANLLQFDRKVGSQTLLTTGCGFWQMAIGLCAVPRIFCIFSSVEHMDFY